MNPEARLTRAQAARLLGVQPATVGMWKLRGKVDTDEHGRYRLGDLLQVERETRRSPNNRVPRAVRRAA